MPHAVWRPPGSEGVALGHQRGQRVTLKMLRVRVCLCVCLCVSVCVCV